MYKNLRDRFKEFRDLGMKVPDFVDPRETDDGSQLLYNACHVMVHETGHMFGMTHCTHYECTMNGFNSANELELMKKCKRIIPFYHII